MRQTLSLASTRALGSLNSLCPPATQRCRMRAILLSLAIVAVVAHPSSSRATIFSPSFGGPSLDAGLVASGSPGTSYTVGGGTLSLAQSAGSGDGLLSISTSTPVSGDFVAMVTAVGVGLGKTDLGLMLGTADFSQTLADVFLNDNSSTVNGNLFQPSFNGAFQPKSTETVTLTLSRFGNTVTDIVDTGSGPVVINSGTDPGLGSPTTLNLFLLEAVEDTGAHQGAFTHFELATGADAATVLPEPGTGSLLACSILALAVGRVWRRRKSV